MSQELYPSSGDPLTDLELRATAVPVDGSGVTQPVSASSLPLPSGAATAAKQPALGTAGSPSADVITIQGITGGEPIEVTGTLTASGGLTDAELRATPVPVSASSLPLPTGAATETTLATLLTQGGAITGATMPTGGSGGFGWLSAIWKALTDRLPSSLVSGRLSVDIGATVGLTDTQLRATAVPVSIAAPVTVTNLGTFGVQADTELPTAASLADATGNPTAPAVGAFLMGWNGSSWDRVKTVNTGQLKVTQYDASGNAVWPTPAALSDTASNPTTPLVGACEQLWDPVNSQWNRRQAHSASRLITSASYNPGAGASTSSATQTNRTAKFAFIQLTPSSAGTGTLTLRLNGRASGSNWVVLAQIALSSLVVKTIMFGPGCAGTGTGGTTGVDCFVSGILPKFWYVDVVHSAASAWSYLVDVDTF